MKSTGTGNSAAASSTVKFLCSYDGKILPRPSDGKLRYVGGLTRVLSVPRSLSFTELMKKLEELCGRSVTIRCQLPGEELDDVLVTIKSDEDLANLFDVYDRCANSSSSSKIRAFLLPPKTSKSNSASSSSSLSSGASSAESSPTNRRSGHESPMRSRCRSGQRSTNRKFVEASRWCYYPCNLQAVPYLVPHHQYRLI